MRQPLFLTLLASSLLLGQACSAEAPEAQTAAGAAAARPASAPRVPAAAQAVSPATGRLALVFPVDCRLGVTCEIQNYVDRDPAAGAARDYRGGSMSYDAHSGTDIRVPTLKEQRAGVRVLAAADGQVLRVRDGVAYVVVRAAGQRSDLPSRAGDGTTTPCARMPRSATGRPRRRCWCPANPPGRLRHPNRLAGRLANVAPRPGPDPTNWSGLIAIFRAL
jgi:hypothetical protein